jgi:virulence factor Mce-like protein
MNRRGRASIAANPVLIGAVTTLIVVVAVFLAYNANNGLPFVPTRSLDVQFANGANLVRGNEVRSGGFRVGIVEDMEPTRLADGKVGALLHLKLDDRIGEIPVDSTVKVRPKSALGLKYVELEKGTSPRTIANGGLLPASRSSVPVDLDEVYNTFDKPTRIASRENLRGFGDAFTGRGADLNGTIQTAPSLFRHLARVTRNLSDPRTQLDTFFAELADAARIVAPVSKVNARLFTTMANTFEAFSRDPQALKDTIAKSPDTLLVGTRSLAAQRPFLQHTAAFSDDLLGASRELEAALPTVNRALEIGTPVTRRTVGLYDDLQGSMVALKDLAVAPTTIGALRGFTATVTTLQPTLRFLGPYVTVCNSWNWFWTLAAEHLSAPDPSGSEQRALLNSSEQGVPGEDNDSVSSDDANEFAHGKQGQYLHTAAYGRAITDKGEANCQAGQSGYVQRANPYRDRTIKGDPYDKVVADPPVSGGLRVGSTYAKVDRDGKGIGRNVDRVPAGQTFTATPGGRGAKPADPDAPSTPRP